MSASTLLRLGLTAAIALPGLACVETERQSGPVAAEARGTVPVLEYLDWSPWVKIYDPDRAFNGYTLAFFKRRIPVLMDMNGRIVHLWPRVRTRGRIRLLENGSLLAISLGRGVVEYDWQGNLVWQLERAGVLVHHDAVRLANGNTLLIVRGAGDTDDLIEVDRRGEIVWRWRSAEHLAGFFERSTAINGDITHLNSVQEIPSNRWHQAGDPRFRSGNLLVSARNLNMIFVVDRASGEVVWRFDLELDHQHEAHMIGPELPGGGNILFFNNGLQNLYAYRQSSVVEIDPVAGSTLWSYRAKGFFSATAGAQQPLGNGNVLISAGTGNRLFEVARDGSIVWQLAVPFRPGRAQRYPYDFTPQLGAMPRPVERAVNPGPGYRHFDADVYAFASRGEQKEIAVNGQPSRVLVENNVCKDVLLPPKARIGVAYGLNRDRLVGAGRHDYAARFTLRLEVAADGLDVVLVDDVIGLAGAEVDQTWRGRQMDLGSLSRKQARLCLAATEAGSAGQRASADLAFWWNPAITPGEPMAADSTVLDALVDELTPEEIAARSAHLRALGYGD